MKMRWHQSRFDYPPNVLEIERRYESNAQMPECRILVSQKMKADDTQ
jgi:hypothetical protein